jgi:hypothetical protein
MRTCVDCLAGNGDHTVADEMDEVAVEGLHRVAIRDENGDPAEAVLEIRYRRVRVLPPIGKQNRYPALTLTVIHAQEPGTPKNRKKIDWKLLTDLPVQSCKDAIEKLEWYALRWKIEVFHKILKSGCKAEESRLRTAGRLANLISVFCILSWRVKRHAIGTPDRRAKGTPFTGVGKACPGSEQEGPAHRGVTAASLTERCAGGACLPTGASRGGTAVQARCLKRQLALPVSMISQ